ncbi:BrnA antitoxin family protein [Pandoraea terrae]
MRELTQEDLRKFQPAADVLPGVVGKALSEVMLRPRGRPKADQTKVHLNARFDPEVVNAFKNTGSGWQTRMNNALKDWLKTHDPQEA